MDCMAGREEGGGGERGRGRGESPCGGHFILWNAEIYTQTAQVAGAGRRNPCCILHMLYSTLCFISHSVTVYATQGHTMHATCNSMRLRAHMWTRRGFVGGGYRDGGAQGKGFKQACLPCLPRVGHKPKPQPSLRTCGSQQPPAPAEEGHKLYGSCGPNLTTTAHAALAGVPACMPAACLHWPPPASSAPGAKCSDTTGQRCCCMRPLGGAMPPLPHPDVLVPLCHRHLCECSHHPGRWEGGAPGRGGGGGGPLACGMALPCCSCTTTNRVCPEQHAWCVYMCAYVHVHCVCAL